MVSLADLWLPLLLSAVFVFIVSSIIHMALPYHKSDYRRLSEEDRVLESLRTAGVTPGPVYFFPFHTMKDMKTAEVQEKFKRGPVGLLQIRPSGAPQMGKFLGQWFVYCVLISLFVCWLGELRGYATLHWRRDFSSRRGCSLPPITAHGNQS